MPARTHARSETVYEIRLYPARRAVISAAWREHEASPRDVAASLGLSTSTLYREIRRAWADASAEQIAADLPGYRASVAIVA